MSHDEPPVSDGGPAAAPPLLDTPEARDALNCPLCAYSLRGLAAAEQPQCPECGYRFEWVELLRARQHAHPYLFEHHPRRSIRSFLRTLLAGMFPMRFWSSLNAGHDIRLRRLIIYGAVVAAAVVLLGVAGTFAARGFNLYRQNTAFILMGRGTLPVRSTLNGAFFQSVVRDTLEGDTLELYLLIAALAWPWLTMATLLVFRASMRRVKVRPAHVLRCVVYSGDVFIWTGAAVVVVTVLRWLDILGQGNMWDSTLVVRQTAGGFLVILAIAAYRLGVSYRRYLRFDHPWSTALASQIVVFLIITTALSRFYGQFWKLVPAD